MLLYDSLIENENDRFEFEAGIHGIDLKKEEDKLVRGTPRQSEETPQFPFKDPKEYAHLSEEERQKATEKAMSYWKRKTEGRKHGLGGNN